MKRALLVVSLILGVAGISGCATKPQVMIYTGPAVKTEPHTTAVKPASTNVFVDEKSKASYAIGMAFGHNLEQQGVEVDQTQVARGLKDLLAGGTMLLTPSEAQAAITNYQAQLAVKNKADGEIFMLTNKNNPGVITLPDGLQYKVIASGTGALPAADSIVTVNYRGTFISGKEFDNSARLGHAAQIPMNQIPLVGWREALAKMNVGAKWQLFIPSELAYGAAGRPPIVPPNATLLLEVELLDVQSPAAPAPAPAVVAPAPPLTSDIIAVPSAEEINKGKKPYTIKQEDLEKMKLQNQTN